MLDLTNSIVKGIQDSQKARIKLTTLDGRKIHLDCIFKESNALHFFLVFPPNTLPNNIDLDKKHPVSVIYQSNPILLVATVVAYNGSDTLELIAKDTVDPVSLREYFRVNMTTTIRASFKEDKKKVHSQNWSMTGKTQDLSATGVLALFPSEPKDKNQILLEIHLPDTHMTVKATAHVVRTRRLRKMRWQVAYHFDRINNRARDQIIQCCLREQRKLLRDKVQIRH